MTENSFDIDTRFVALLKITSVKSTMLLNEIQSALVKSLTNIDSSRVRPPSQHSRTEGWTEVFGALDGVEQEDHKDHWEVDEEAVRR